MNIDRWNTISRILFGLCIASGAIMVLAGMALQSAPQAVAAVTVGGTAVLCALLLVAHVAIRRHVERLRNERSEGAVLFVTRLCIALGFLGVAIAFCAALASGRTPAWIQPVILGLAAANMAIAAADGPNRKRD